MPDQSSQTIQSNDVSAELPPPSGDSKKANKYIIQLIDLINTDKLIVSHTDLAQFDPSALQDHYRLELKDYEVEISHSKQPDSGKDLYVILFNNLKHVNNRYTEKVILAYMHLTDSQFKSFKATVGEQQERQKKAAEEKRLNDALLPIDQALSDLTTSS